MAEKQTFGNTNLTNEKVFKLISERVEKGEKLQLGCMTVQMPDMIWYFVIGPFASLMMKQYYIGITGKAIYFSLLNLLGSVVQTDRFEQSEIEKVKISGAFLQSVVNIEFKNKRKLNLRISALGRLNYTPVIEYFKGLAK
jgi:hypothetical protein